MYHNSFIIHSILNSVDIMYSHTYNIDSTLQYYNRLEYINIYTCKITQYNTIQHNTIV